MNLSVRWRRTSTPSSSATSTAVACSRRSTARSRCCPRPAGAGRRLRHQQAAGRSRRCCSTAPTSWSASAACPRSGCCRGWTTWPSTPRTRSPCGARAPAVGDRCRVGRRGRGAVPAPRQPHRRRPARGGGGRGVALGRPRRWARRSGRRGAARVEVHGRRPGVAARRRARSPPSSASTAAVVGVCGGYQMLGRTLSDPLGVEAEPGTAVPGLGWLDVDTTWSPEKVTRQRHGTATAAAGKGEVVHGYEIHQGRTTLGDGAESWLDLDGVAEGAVGDSCDRRRDPARPGHEPARAVRGRRLPGRGADRGGAGRSGVGADGHLLRGGARGAARPPRRPRRGAPRPGRHRAAHRDMTDRHMADRHHREHTVITTILFDIGDTLVRAAAPATPVEDSWRSRSRAWCGPCGRSAGTHRLGAVTDAAVMRSADVRGALAGSGIDELLEVIVTSGDVARRSPTLAGSRPALAELGAAAGGIAVRRRRGCRCRGSGRRGCGLRPGRRDDRSGRRGAAGDHRGGRAAGGGAGAGRPRGHRGRGQRAGAPGSPHEAGRRARPARGAGRAARRDRGGRSAAAAPSRRGGGVRRRPRRGRRRGDALAPGGHRPDGGQLRRRGCRHQRAGPPGRRLGDGGRRRCRHRPRCARAGRALRGCSAVGCARVRRRWPPGRR